MITFDKIELFKRNKLEVNFAFGSPKFPQTIPETDKELYWDIMSDLETSFKNALRQTKMGEDFYIKPQKFSKEKGVRGHRPLSLWCAARNIGSEAFNEMPQIYAIVSDAGVEVGFAVSIPESDYSDMSVKTQNREIIPLIHDKLPTTGLVIQDLENLLTSSSNWHINSGTRKKFGEKGFDAFTTVSEMFVALKSETVSRGGGCIAKIISPEKISKKAVDLEKEVEEALGVFSKLQKLCAPTQPDRGVVKIQQSILSQSHDEFDPENLIDGRLKKLTMIAQRRGQSAFRNKLMEIYQGKCVISGCNVAQVLQAAHIMPYSGKETNKVDNGLLMRSDLHDLFDQFLITINPTDKKITVNSKLQNTEYFVFNGQTVLMPSQKIKSASVKALKWHFDEAEKIGL